MILREHGTRRILRSGRMAAAAKPIYAAQAGTDCSIASLLINCPTRDVRFTPKADIVQHLCAKSGHAKRLPVRFGARPSFNGIPLPLWGQRVTSIFI